MCKFSCCSALGPQQIIMPYRPALPVRGRLTIKALDSVFIYSLCWQILRLLDPSQFLSGLHGHWKHLLPWLAILQGQLDSTSICRVFWYLLCKEDRFLTSSDLSHLLLFEVHRQILYTTAPFFCLVQYRQASGFTDGFCLCVLPWCCPCFAGLLWQLGFLSFFFFFPRRFLLWRGN